MESALLKYIYRHFVSFLSPRFPRMASRIVYIRGMKKIPNLKRPVFFSEKLMKLKLEDYFNNPKVWLCADKFRMREYARNCGVSDRNLPKLLGFYTDALDINFEELPNQFALKCSHGAGFNIICSDKNSLDIPRAVEKLNLWLKTPFGLDSAELHYNKVDPVIICEEFIQPEIEGSLPFDYKVYCFDGVPKFILGCMERVENHSKVEMFDLNWLQTGFIKPEFTPAVPMSRPSCLQDMLKLSALVSKEFSFVRVDFYVERGVPILGELTFTPHACVNSNMTQTGQEVLGSMLDLQT